MARALWPHKRKLSEIAYLSRRYPVWCKLASNLSQIKMDTAAIHRRQKAERSGAFWRPCEIALLYLGFK